MTELFELPQIVSARSPQGMDRAVKLFSLLTESVVELSPEEAELAKLFTNVWRYIKFAAANQFYMMANDRGLDFERIRKGLSQDYPRAADMPGAGFAAGPCLFKDTMQLAAFNHNNFALGHTAMTINEGLPLYLVHRLEQKYDLSTMTVGILGMAFKGESDDIRSSLSYKLKRILEFKADKVLSRRPVRHRRPAAAPAGGGHRPVRPAGDRHPAPAVPRPGDGQAGGGHLERARSGCARMTGESAAGLRGDPGLQRGRAHPPGARPDLRGGAPAVRGARGGRRPGATPRSRSWTSTRSRSRGCAAWSTPTGAARPTRSGSASTSAAAPVAVVTMADGCDDPRQIDDLARLVDRGVAVAAASRYMPGGQQVGGPGAQGPDVQDRRAGRCGSSRTSAPGTRPTRSRHTRRSSSASVGIDSRDGFEIGIELTAKAAPDAAAGRGDPHDLA